MARPPCPRPLSAPRTARASEALELLFEALVINPHALALHQAIWQTLSHLKLPPALVERYVDLDPRRHLLRRSAHLRPLPLSQH